LDGGFRQNAATLSALKSAAPQLLPLLKQYFGFTSFRPLQEEIIRDSLAGRDVFALLPTGGGKSLCFQLPALARDGLTIVVSPLIALMKDQVDALQAGGVPATFLNSSLAAGEGRQRLRGLHNGEYRLLYAAPERLMLSGFLEDLRRWSVRLIAIDEAHCISEWGHDFRPEYRQLAQLRQNIGAHPERCRRCQSHHGRLWKNIAQLRKLAVLGPEIVAPFADAMRLINRNQAGIPFLEALQEP